MKKSPSLKDEIKDQILDLKTHLYVKFGYAINLENYEYVSELKFLHFDIF